MKGSICLSELEASQKSSSLSLDKYEKGQMVKNELYRNMIGPLLHFIANRMNIVFSVYLYPRFWSNPKKSHLGGKIAKKNTSGSCKFVRNFLMSLFSWKQNFDALSFLRLNMLQLEALILGTSSYSIRKSYNIPIKCANASSITLTSF